MYLSEYHVSLFSPSLYTNGLHVIHLNIRSLPQKMDLLGAWLVYNKLSVITHSQETWLNGYISDEEIQFDKYVSYRADRGVRGGGVAPCFFKLIFF